MASDKQELFTKETASLIGELQNPNYTAHITGDGLVKLVDHRDHLIICYGSRKFEAITSLSKLESAKDCFKVIVEEMCGKKIAMQDVTVNMPVDDSSAICSLEYLDIPQYNPLNITIKFHL